MSLMRIQARLQRDGGIPEDDAVNVWHFDSDQSFSDDADDTVDRLATFYAAIGGLLASTLAGTVHFKLYDMEASKPRVPVYTAIDDVFTPGGGELPAEMAIRISMYAQPVSGLNQKRRRGGIYLGPLSAGVGSVSGADVRVTQTARETIATAVAELAHGPDPGDARLAIYSPTTDAASTTADSFNDVVGGWVDNAFDVQRRRGADPTARTTWVPA